MSSLKDVKRLVEDVAPYARTAFDLGTAALSAYRERKGGGSRASRVPSSRGDVKTTTRRGGTSRTYRRPAPSRKYRKMTTTSQIEATDSGIGAGFQHSKYRKPKTPLRKRKWLKANKMVQAAISAPFKAIYVIPIADPIQTGGTRTWGLAPGFQSGSSGGSLQWPRGQQGYFASPLMYCGNHIWDTAAYQSPYSGAAGSKTMSLTPHIGLIDTLINNLGPTQNPGIAALNPVSGTNVNYRILSSQLQMTITNQSNVPVRLKEYKCVLRRDVPDDLFNHGNDYTSLQAHLQLYYSGHYFNAEASLGVTQWNVTAPGTTPFQNPTFCKWFKIVAVRDIELNGGQTSTSVWSDQKGMRVDMSMAQDKYLMAPKGAYFFLYTALAKLVFDSSHINVTDYGPIDLGAMSRCLYECTIPPANSLQTQYVDMRQSAFAGSADIINDDSATLVNAIS